MLYLKRDSAKTRTAHPEAQPNGVSLEHGWNTEQIRNGQIQDHIMLDYGGVREHHNLFILNCRKDKVILRLPRLQAINPEIN